MTMPATIDHATDASQVTRLETLNFIAYGYHVTASFSLPFLY
jgi:hypothetical protein